jgi:hypothetical protein
MLIAWLGYLNSVYGWTLLKGYDVSWVTLANPVKVYDWPAGGPPLIPDTQVWPTRAAQAAAAADVSGVGTPAGKIPGGGRSGASRSKK